MTSTPTDWTTFRQACPDLLHTAIAYARCARDEKEYGSGDGEGLIHVLRFYEPQVCLAPDGTTLSTAYAGDLVRNVTDECPDLAEFFETRQEA
jgi:hypothetical protein